jgi:hypothetical protein
MWEFIKPLWPRSFGAWFGLILGSFSVAKLFQLGFEHGFGLTLTLLLDYYEDLMRVLIASWSEPLIAEALAGLRRWFAWDLHLYPHWKHIFLLLGIYFSRAAGNTFRLGLPVSGTVHLLWGFVVALVCSVVAGTVTLSQHDALANFLIGAIPISGIAVFNVGENAWRATWLREHEALITHKEAGTWRGFFTRELLVILGQTAIGIALLLIGLQLPAMRDLSSPGLGVLGTLILLIALYGTLLGALGANGIREAGETWPSAFWRTTGANVGTAMLGVFFWFSVLVAANAGLRLYNL